MEPKQRHSVLVPAFDSKEIVLTHAQEGHAVEARNHRLVQLAVLQRIEENRRVVLRRRAGGKKL